MMQIGMLWFDNNPQTALPAKIARAAQYYRDKYCAQPNICFIHPDALPAEVECPGIEVRASATILPGHLWIGVAEQE